MSISRWMDKEDVVHIHNEILFIHKKETNPTFCSNMDGTRGYYAQWNKSGREKTNIKWFPSFVEYKNKAKLKEQNSSRLTEPKNGLTVTQGKGLGRVVGKGGVKGVRRITITTHNMWGWHGEGCATQGRQVVILQHLTTLMDSDCNGVCWANLVKGVAQ